MMRLDFLEMFGDVGIRRSPCRVVVVRTSTVTETSRKSLSEAAIDQELQELSQEQCVPKGFVQTGTTEG